MSARQLLTEITYSRTLLPFYMNVSQHAGVFEDNRSDHINAGKSVQAIEYKINVRRLEFVFNHIEVRLERPVAFADPCKKYVTLGNLVQALATARCMTRTLYIPFMKSNELFHVSIHNDVENTVDTYRIRDLLKPQEFYVNRRRELGHW
jgi:hypothetical protein